LNLFTVIGFIVVVLLVLGYFGLRWSGGGQAFSRTRPPVTVSARYAVARSASAGGALDVHQHTVAG